MFEDVPIGIINILILLKALNLEEVQDYDSTVLIMISTGATVLKILKEFLLIRNSAKYLKDTVVHYTLSMMKAGYDWIPLLNELGKSDINFS